MKYIEKGWSKFTNSAPIEETTIRIPLFRGGKVHYEDLLSSLKGLQVNIN